MHVYRNSITKDDCCEVNNMAYKFSWISLPEWGGDVIELNFKLACYNIWSERSKASFLGTK